jgi:putative transposase
MDWKQLLASITGSVDEELRLRNAYLAAENRILRNQIKARRLLLTDAERKILAEIGHQLGRQALQEIATIAKLDTILAWHRKFMDQQDVRSPQRQSVGRPRIDKELEDLVVRMARENRSWGYDRIVGALSNLGYGISDQTVGNIWKRQGLLPAPERKKTTTWREFIRLHMAMLLATDFFTHEVWSWFGLVISALLCFLHCGRQNICEAGMTLHDHMPWMLPFLSRSLHVHTVMERWVRVVRQAALSRLLLCGKGVRHPPLSAFPTDDERASILLGMGKAVRMPAAHSRQIRDGPLRHRQPRDELLKNTHREAA